ncbi:OstA family protein [Anaeromyxobacter dehalogenans 2CP-1]|uniref:OstA family protein n=1 Tax=Anaeromyxobacter dehalogenans (strain ATCC BAA-258 / DSM 21875 / 2CP-1) TaxID=455488 RepID=B8JBN1_ANAD2|nr:LptA/OstA family protein [Anaeromyxobacter dehalogenans]ACL67639.1 OstA family protein [Anaeromyxobacter dehalogenans 2CP-1]
MIALLAAALLTAAPAPAQGKPVTRPAPAAKGAARAAPDYRVDAAEVRYAFQRREVVFTGKPVTLTRDDAVLTCARLEAKNDEAGVIETAVCRGDVKLVRGERTVTCQTATYENAAARVTCDGAAVLRDRGTEAHGRRLVYELRTDEVKLEGGGVPVRITVPGAEVEQRRRELDAQRKGQGK